MHKNFGRTAGVVDLDDLNGGLTLATPLADAPVIAQLSGISQQGSSDSETLQAAADDDTLYGGSGTDIFIGGDPFNGGAGRDTASYEGSLGSLLVDSQFFHENTFAASGDICDSIENLIRC